VKDEKFLKEDLLVWGGRFIFSEGKNPKKTTCKTQAGLALSGGTICYNQGLVAAFANCTLNSSFFPLFFVDFLLSLRSFPSP